MTSTIQIRPVTQDDYAAWHALWLGYNAFYGRHGATALAEEITRACSLPKQPVDSVARQLIEAVYAQAHAAGSPRVYWQTHETNHTAMKLYDTIADKSGFIVYRKML